MKNSAANSKSSLSPGDIFNPHRQFYGTWIPQWLDERCEVSERAKKLYAYLARFAGAQGKAWPSYSTLAEKLHVTRRHVIRLLCELSQHRLIKVTHVNDLKYGHRANVYEFLWHEWIQHAEDRKFKMVVPEESPPEEILDDFEDSFVTKQSSISTNDSNVTRVVGLPKTTPSDIYNTPLVEQLPPSDVAVTNLVTLMSPRSQENKEKRINYKHRTESGACKSLFSKETFSISTSHAESARHSAALVRKGWQVARKLLQEFWDNCKIRPDLRILFGYVSRALRAGYEEQSIQDAFQRALHECHGHATDCEKVWEASSTVHRAEKWVKENGKLWKPISAEERRHVRAQIAEAIKNGGGPNL